MESYDWARELQLDRWLWHVFLGSGDQRVVVFVDHADGRVHGVVDVIIN